MTAYRLLEWGSKPTFVEIEQPNPGPNEVLVRIGAVGLCHSDILIQDSPAGVWPFDPPFTMGHENAGWIEEVGSEVDSVSVGTPVLVSCVRSCGSCARCFRGEDNYCWWSTQYTTRGVGLDGGLASHMVAPAREVVPLTNLAPRDAAVLSDAGATSYHAVRKALSRLTPGSTAVVIGAGGLGGFAIQYLRLLSSARVIAVDLSASRLEFATQLGADETVLSDESAAEEIQRITAGQGADAIFDFVGVDSTLALAVAVSAPLGRITVCGANPGRVAVGWGAIPGGCEFVVSLGNTLADLRAVVALAEQGKLRIETESFAFAEIEQAYQKLREGALRNRALIVMD